MFSALLGVISAPWLLFLTVLVLLLTYDYRRRLGLPPGPYGLPFVGYMFFVNRNHLSKKCSQLGKKYNSDIISISNPGAPLIYVNSYELAKECFQKRTELADRPPRHIFRAFDDEYNGIITTSGPLWKEVRRFSISILRDFGMGRIGAEENIQREYLALAGMIRSQNGQPFNPRLFVMSSVSNIICGMVFGQRFDHNDERFKLALSGLTALFDRFTSLPFILSLRNKFIRENFFRKQFFECADAFHQFHGFVQDRIAEHRESYNGEVTDMIHAYMKEMENGRDFFDEKSLKYLISDYFMAGTETTSTTLTWSLLAMAAHQDIQNKVSRELNDVIGGRKVGMNDKKDTPYTDAVLCEIQRHFTLVTFAVPHCCTTSDIEVNGYKIPKNSPVFYNVDAIHHDPGYWKNPDEFDPENFLVDGKVDNLERLVPFGIGRRSCAGEALARMEVYVFFASLIKDFEVKLETDESVADFQGTVAAVYTPKPYKIRMIPRV